MFLFKFLNISFLIIAFVPLHAQNIYAFAGIGTNGFSGDAGQAILAQLYYPAGVAVDGSGNIYFCDSQNHRIRKIDPSGIINTVGGGGVSLADGILATSAGIPQPNGITVDAAGNIYFSEKLYAQIRKISTSGIITTIAGNGSPGFSGDGGPAISAQLNTPNGITIDGSGNLYIAEGANHRIRKVTATGTISTIAGTLTSGFSGDGSLATSAEINNPSDVKLDMTGNIYIADNGNKRIRRIDPSGIINTIAGTGGSGFTGDGGFATLAQIGSPGSLFFDLSGNLFFTDNWNGLLRKINTSGIISKIAGTGTPGYSGDGGPAILSQLNDPGGLCIDANNNIYFSETFNSRLRIICVSNCAMGIEEKESTNEIKLFPNPTSDYLNLELQNQTNISEIEITNQLGQTILKQAYNKQIDVSFLFTGCYFIKLISEDKTVYHSKFVKE
jgi:sugar lactone lactonase YvrE